MKLAKTEEFEEVKQIFYKHKKWFPHIRTDYMRRMISTNRLIFENNVVITFHHAKRKQTIGDVQVRKGDTVLHQIASKNGGGGKMLRRFFDWCPRDVFLSVRSDNINACNFYDKIGMELIGTHNWAKGTVPGKVYVKRKSN